MLISALPIPLNATLKGLTQIEWVNEWGEYVLSIPGDINSLFEETGENANIGQSGPVLHPSGTLTGADSTLERERLSTLNELDNILDELLIPPDQPVEGLTQAEWGNEWWKYVLSIPGEINPLFDETGENANIGQSGPVFYLSGALTGDDVTIVREISVPTDKFIFYPLLNALDNTLNVPGFPTDDRTPEEVINDVTEAVAMIDTDLLFATINGKAVPDLDEQLQISSEAFDIMLPENNLISELFGFPVTLVPNSVSGGYWIMLNPLPAREDPYIINFGGTTPDNPDTPEDESVTLNITYIIKTYNQIVGTNRKNILFGTKFNDEMKGLNGKDFLIGLGASDDLDGGNGPDTLIGVNPVSKLPGFHEIDALTGGNGPDTFALGDFFNVYYDDGDPDTQNQGLRDYALITDLENNDVIVLKGSPEDYFLVDNFILGATTGTGIFLKEEPFDELIGIAEGVAGLNLNSNDFRFV